MNTAKKDIFLFKDYRPHEKQKEFHASKARFKALAAGTRSGKTYGGARDFIKLIYEDRAKKKGRLNYWVVAPDYSLTEVAKEEIADILGAESPEEMDTSPLVKAYNKSKFRLQLHGNILIEFKSAERPEKLVARGLDGAWMDEAARCPEVAWSNVRARLADRQGWGLFSSTPMGKNWFYEQIYRLGDRLDPLFDPLFASFHFTTVDNTAVPWLAKEVELAKKQMPARYFKRDFLASFDAFAGQIYDEFDRSIHVVDRHPKRFTRVIACKDWGFRPNPGVTLVIGITGSGNWYVIHEEYQTELLITPVSEHDKDPCWVRVDKALQEKYGIECFYVDPSEPEYIAAYRKAGIQVKEANNSVLPGIQAVATFLHVNEDTGRPRLFVCEWCPNTIREIEGYHWKQLKDGTTLEIPDKVDDHTCLVAGTKVLTNTGEKKIENIIPGDLVLTREGYRPVLWQGLTKRDALVMTVEFSDNRKIVGTRNHPVWVKGKGWVPLGSLQKGDKITTPEEVQLEGSLCKVNAWNSTELSFEDTLNQKEDQIKCTTPLTPLTGEEVSEDCTKRFGKKPTGQFQKGILFIIKTVTRLITISKISNASPQRNITEDTQKWGSVQPNTWKELDLLRQNGTGRRKVAGGTPNMAKELGRIINLLQKHVTTAARILKTTLSRGRGGFVAMLVSPLGGENLVRTTYKRPALFAETPLLPVNTKGGQPAQKNALHVCRVYRSGKRDVYNLKVADTPEFFAEGVLVHNCDSLRYAVLTVLMEAGPIDPVSALLLRTMKVH